VGLNGAVDVSTADVGGGSVLGRIRELGLVPVVEVEWAEDAQRLLDVLTSAGLPIMEITLRTPTAIDILTLLRETHPEALLGAGTVRTIVDAQRAIEAGARFIVSPSTNRGLIQVCVDAQVPTIPGVCTPTEVDEAIGAGASLVKFFPAEPMGGVPFLRALAAPFRDVDFLPTGGIDPSNLAAYLELPNVAACGGSWFVSQHLIRERAFERVELLVREAIAIVREVRSHF
jgi:2-dehydro-3-deoxyphosphogluconate aldolase/(4S)-4-hydroxy-2-oxoglutarate aldolase